MKAAAVAVALVAVALVALVGCGPQDAAPPAAPPAGSVSDPAGVREVEDIVNDLQNVVGSAESEIAAN